MQRAGQWADGGGVADKGPIRERVDDINRLLHLEESSIAWVIAAAFTAAVDATAAHIRAPPKNRYSGDREKHKVLNCRDQALAARNLSLHRLGCRPVGQVSGIGKTIAGPASRRSGSD
jgi:hypothetical protein